jgi:hypothetical protein
MIHCLPNQRLINPWLHRSFHPNIELVNPIHNVGKNSQLNCHTGDRLLWKEFDERWEASRLKWAESGIRKLFMGAFENVPHQQLEGIQKIVAFGFGSYDTVFHWNPALHHGHERLEQLNLIVARHHAIQDLQTIEKSGEDHKERCFYKIRRLQRRTKTSRSSNLSHCMFLMVICISIEIPSSSSLRRARQCCHAGYSRYCKN